MTLPPPSPIIDAVETVAEIFRAHARRISGIEPGEPEQILELERIIGRPLPREYRSFLLLAGNNAGSLRFLQQHKQVFPSLADALKNNRSPRRGRRKEKDATIYFADGPGCQDCGPAFLVLSPIESWKDSPIDPENPPVGGRDYDDLVLLAETFSAYVRSAIPPPPPRGTPRRSPVHR